MDPVVQNVVALLLLTTAIVYLGYRAWQMATRKQASGCGGGCKACPTKSGTASHGIADRPADFKLVSIQLEPSKDRRDRS